MKAFTGKTLKKRAKTSREASFPSKKKKASAVNDASGAASSSTAGQKVTSDSDGEIFWAIEKLVGRRLVGDGVVEYRVRWKNCSNDTWQQDDGTCFCELTSLDARKLDRQAAAREVKQRKKATTETAAPVTRLQQNRNEQTKGGGCNKRLEVGLEVAKRQTRTRQPSTQTLRSSSSVALKGSESVEEKRLTRAMKKYSVARGMSKSEGIRAFDNETSIKALREQTIPLSRKRAPVQTRHAKRIRVMEVSSESDATKSISLATQSATPVNLPKPFGRRVREERRACRSDAEPVVVKDEVEKCVTRGMRMSQFREDLKRDKVREKITAGKAPGKAGKGQRKVAAGNLGPFYDIEQLVGRRVEEDGRVLYKVRWLGLAESEDTWEPYDCFCAKTIQDAKDLDRRALASRQDESASSVEQCPNVCTWTDSRSPCYVEVQIIDVNDKHARQLVAEARSNGIPVKIKGHAGWAQFAQRWLSPSEDGDGWLDLSDKQALDVRKMKLDIGAEVVPVLRKGYDESNPIDGKTMTVSSFLQQHWNVSQPSALNWAPRKKPSSNMYLHQWQFPLSKTAATKLCGADDHRPLPNDILGEDLLSYCNDGNEYSHLQFLFMGGKDTMSKLHRDNGGLLISIAPIVGEKEVVLIHRSDLACCKIEVDFANASPDAFPARFNPRMFKTVVKPGEILLMPQGTYHQCRNITPCLSYSRFWLDKQNLAAFRDSLLEGDAPEILHDMILQKTAAAMCDKLNSYSTRRILRSNAGMLLQSPPAPSETARTVDAALALRHAITEIIRRFGLQSRDQLAREWQTIVEDITCALHDFQCPNCICSSPARRAGDKDPVRQLQDEPLPAGLAIPLELERQKRVVTPFERLILKAPMIEVSASLEVASTADLTCLSRGDRVILGLQGRLLHGTVVRVEKQILAAYLCYEGFDPINDEFQPVDRLRQPVPGDASSKVDSRPGALVVCPDLDGEEYRATVDYSRLGALCLVALDGSGPRRQVERWVVREWVLQAKS